uniref:Uncharacterized protein LOC100368389 n=1 Tax=Saccoglossus kowalevskii TaxID=10224 RepID=A0ABM0GZ52_SACKO|nr:PREDICTED: uncharacterized protein LOC100375713 [Saccoglossus kowalevskii]XP_002740601.1 PREDICTED: uncharacterized protein LOC100368389 [Saccoglossus kowalevskii]
MAANYDLAMIEEALRTVENVDEPRSCKCKGACMRKHGRGACPCKTWDELCNDACSCGKHRPCMNKASDSTSEDSDGAEDAVAVNTRIPQRKRRLVVQRQVPLSEEDKQRDHKRKMQEFVSGLPRERLEHITLELFRRQPGACADLVLQEGSDPTISNPPPDPLPVPKPNETTPPWCKCGQCINMPTQIENKCCVVRQGQECLTGSWLFQHLVLDGDVLEVAMRVVADVYAENPLRDNACFRHYAYRQFIYWQYGRLGKGNRRVVPSCCVWAVRRRFPSPNNVYVGFKEGAIQD